MLWMRVLVVQNYDNTGLGQVGKALAEAGADIDIRDAHLGQALPVDSGGHDAIVVLGGGQNALADDEYPYMPALLELMRDFSSRDKSVLGICLGSQLLARAFGGENLIGAAPEFGWSEVLVNKEGAADPVLRHASAGFRPFQWHDDTFSLPPGALRLASSAAAQNQAFRIGRATYGIQFHFEADRALVRRWSAAFTDYLEANQPRWKDIHAAEEARHGAPADAAGLALARAWVATI
jgi:GMP synthase-like glutamine amidotransferase